MTTKINASTAGLTETVDTSGILELQTANTTALIIDASQNANFASTGAITVPVGTTAQRPTGTNGMIRYNTSTNGFEFYANNTWTGANVTPPAVISVAPVISGSPVVGQNLTSTTGTWTGSVSGYYYQWLANSTAISNATANVFTLTSTQNNTNITCNVTAYNIAGNSTPSTSNTLGPVTSTYLINKSLRFRSSASAYMNRTFGTPTDNKKYTISMWMKRGKLGSQQSVIGSFASGTDYSAFYFDSSDKLNFTGDKSNANLFGLTTNAVYRDPSAWYHMVVVFDSSNATTANRCIIYVNGVSQSLTGTTVPLNAASYFNTASIAANIGFLNTTYYDGYLADVYLIDGQALTPSSFGQTDSTTGAWIPNAYTGTYGTNGFYLPFSNTTSTTTLGYDSSGNGNNWTTNNISLTAGTTYDSMTDVPTLNNATTSNYAVLNPLDKGGLGAASITDGNLKITYSAADSIAFGTIGLTSGKWYWEITGISVTSGTNFTVGVSPSPYTSASSRLYASNGQYYNGSSWASYGASYTNNDVVGVALDLDSQTIEFFKNGTSQGQKTSIGLSGITEFPQIYINNSGNSAAANFGQQPFAYTPPTGFVALNAYNL